MTAKGESALAVLQEKLPERIRALSVALLSHEHEGLRQFAYSIQTIATRVANLKPKEVQDRIAVCEKELNWVHARIAAIDQKLSAFAEKHLQTYRYQGRDLQAGELAKLVVEQEPQHGWFDDTPPLTNTGEPPVDALQIEELRRARIAVGENLKYFDLSLPCLAALPSPQEILDVHRDLLTARDLDVCFQRGDFLALVDVRPETLERAQVLAQVLEKLIALKGKLEDRGQPWLVTLCERFAQMGPDALPIVALLKLCSDVRELERQRQECLGMAIAVPPDAELSQDLVHAIKRLAAGKRAFALPFVKSGTRRLLTEITVSGVTPAGRSDWGMVERVLVWRVEVRKVVARWSALVQEFGLATPSPGVEDALRDLVAWQGGIEEARKLVFELAAPLAEQVAEVFGAQVATRLRNADEAFPKEVFLKKVYLSLQAHFERQRLAKVEGRIRNLVGHLEASRGGILDDLRSLVTDTLGQRQSDQARLQAKWQQLFAELEQLIELQPSFSLIKSLTAAIEAAGAPRWAKRLRTEPAGQDVDSLIPTSWLEAWQWRQAVIYLDGIGGFDNMRELFLERRHLTTNNLTRLYRELVEEKAWLGVFNNATEEVRQALQSYVNAVQAMGSGTGIRAVRYRKDARAAMQRAYKAVPCWIMPQWRVSETIPPDLGLFDLVIIDEASQCDISVFLSLMRGQKLLVVGDHQQVSPSAVGIAEEQIIELRQRFLQHQPYGAEMTPDKSIYDLARVVFAGNSVMLKEHFRCVPAIIEFSNREFYEGEIRPLRWAPPNERLEPPLVDVFVIGGRRERDINKAEAQAIVDEIEAIVADTRYAGRTIGVVTLLGTEQAAYIQRLIVERIPPQIIVERQIAVGPPPVFQGRERHIMFVSMVISLGDHAAANRKDILQRFNVAMSRARDRMYLFRSVRENDVREDSLNWKVIRHFKQPFLHNPAQVQLLRDRCESDFERAIFDELVRRGFRVQPQVPCGSYRIDLVVEGEEGRRLAIECDGDRFHGPGRWQDDLARQRILERAGWVFWRCFASSFYRQRESVLEHLLKTLNDMEIQPLGAEMIDIREWVQYKEVDPFGVHQHETLAANPA